MVPPPFTLTLMDTNASIGPRLTTCSWILNPASVSTTFGRPMISSATFKRLAFGFCGSATGGTTGPADPLSAVPVPTCSDGISLRPVPTRTVLVRRLVYNRRLLRHGSLN